MIWQNPWAWLGLAAITLPVLIHLLGRGHARVQPFPSLRFLERSKLLPTRRTRIHDLLLLIVRVAILAAAVAALAQPLLLTSGRKRAIEQTLARAIVVDSSASMRRPAMSGGIALDAARRDAQQLGAESQIATTIETSTPSRAVSGAVEWLEHQAGRRELVIASDFQANTLRAADLALVPPSIGVRLSRVNVAADSAPLEDHTSVSVARVTLSADKTAAEWTSAVAPRDGGLVLLANAAERARADAAARAAATLGARLPFDSARMIAIVFPTYEQRAELLRASKPLDVPWMTSVVASLRADSLLLGASASTASLVTDLDSTRLVVTRDASGRAVIVAARGDVLGRDRLVLFSAIDAGTVASAALIAAVDRARSVAAPLSELDPAVISETTINAWQRAPSTDARATSDTAGESDARWFWIAVLVLLAIEAWLRRARRETVVAELKHDRAA